MGGGYVLDFTDREYTTLFKDAVNINIDASLYSIRGSSKAKRLRQFWDVEQNPAIIGKVLEQMLAIWLHNQTDKDKVANNPTYISVDKTVARLLGKKPATADTEADFLNVNFSKISVSKLPIESSLVPILEARLKEINNCLGANSPFAAVILTGSILERLLLACALSQPQRFNQAKASPKGPGGKVRQFQDWTLGNFIDVAYEVGILKVDVKKFSHSLRDFRNFIHPYAQMSSGFKPDQHTAKICLQVLKAAIVDVSGER